jgi:hypothetical protein
LSVTNLWTFFDAGRETQWARAEGRQRVGGNLRNECSHNEGEYQQESQRGPPTDFTFSASQWVRQIESSRRMGSQTSALGTSNVPPHRWPGWKRATAGRAASVGVFTMAGTPDASAVDPLGAACKNTYLRIRGVAQPG